MSSYCLPKDGNENESVDLAAPLQYKECFGQNTIAHNKHEI